MHNSCTVNIFILSLIYQRNTKHKKMNNNNNNPVSINLKWNKINVDGIIQFDGFSKYVSSNKKDFANWIQQYDKFEIVVSGDRNKNKVQKIIKNAGFKIEIDEFWGFDWEQKIFASK